MRKYVNVHLHGINLLKRLHQPFTHDKYCQIHNAIPSPSTLCPYVWAPISCHPLPSYTLPSSPMIKLYPMSAQPKEKKRNYLTGDFNLRGVGRFGL